MKSLVVTTDNAVIEGVAVSDVDGHGILVKDCSGVTIRDCAVIRPSRSGVGLYNTSNVTIERLYVCEPSLSGVHAFLDMDGVVVRDLYVLRPQQDGVTGYGPDMRGWDCGRVTVVDPKGHGAHLGGRDINVFQLCAIGMTRSARGAALYISTEKDGKLLTTWGPVRIRTVLVYTVDGRTFRHGLWTNNVKRISTSSEMHVMGEGTRGSLVSIQGQPMWQGW